MKINIQYIFTKEEKENEEFCDFIDYLDRVASNKICEVIANSEYQYSIDFSGEDKVEG